MSALADLPRKALVAQLIATRDTLMATVSQVDASLMMLGVDLGADGECTHPPEAVTNHHVTLDDAPDDYECTACGARQPTPFHTEE